MRYSANILGAKVWDKVTGEPGVIEKVHAPSVSVRFGDNRIRLMYPGELAVYSEDHHSHTGRKSVGS